MAKDKKRLSKTAKAAQKILADSKLLANAKTISDSKTEQSFQPTDVAPKTSEANKIRPNKKRG